MSAYATLSSLDLDPSECEHDRREKFDSRRCFDCHDEILFVCGTCGEVDGSVYAKRCCTSDNMIEA